MVTKASKRKDNMKGLNIPYMKNYIEKHDNEDGTNMAIFNQLRGLDEAGNKVEFARVAYKKQGASRSLFSCSCYLLKAHSQAPLMLRGWSAFFSATKAVITSL